MQFFFITLPKCLSSYHSDKPEVLLSSFFIEKQMTRFLLHLKIIISELDVP